MKHTVVSPQTMATWIVDHPWRVLLGMLVTVFALGHGIQNLKFTTDYRVFFSEDNPYMLAFDALENTYTKDDNALFLLAPQDGKVFTQKTLRAIQELTEAAWQTPYSIRVDSITNFQHTFAMEDDLVVQDLVSDIDSLDAADLEAIKNIALNEPLLLSRLIAKTAAVTAINVVVQLPGIDDLTETPEVTAFTRNLMDEFRAENPDIDIYLTGMVLFNNAFAESSQNDMKTLVPISLLLILIGIGLLLRSIASSIITLTIILLSVASAMGITGWLNILLTPPSASAPTIIMTLAIADAIHMLVSLFHEMRMGSNKRDAMIESIRINLMPIFLTSITTALGFLSMNFSDAPPFRDLGNIVAMGIIAAFVMSITILPAMIMLLPIKAPAARKRSAGGMDWLATFTITHRKRLLWGGTAIIVGLVSFIPQNDLNDVFIEYFDETMDIRIASDFASNHLGGLYINHYSIESGEPGGISNPEFLQKVDDFAVWYRQQPGVDHVYTITDTMKRLNMNMHGDDPAWYRLPHERELAAQYLLLYEMSLPYGLDLNDQINVDKSSVRIAITMDTLSVNHYLALDSRAQDWLRDNTPDHMHTEGTGATTMFSHIGERNIRSMLSGTTLALILISLILAFALRSVKIGFLSLIPNLVPGAMAFGIWGIVVSEVGLALSVILGMTLGIVVDDSVHFLSKYLRARRERGLDAEQAVRYAFNSVGKALWITTLVLIVGFMFLAQSAFRLNSDMGLMTAMTIALALLADFLFLPPLLMTLDKKRYK